MGKKEGLPKVNLPVVDIRVILTDLANMVAAKPIKERFAKYPSSMVVLCLLSPKPHGSPLGRHAISL